MVDIGKEMGSTKIDDFSEVRNRFIESLDDEEYVLFVDSDEEAPRILLEMCRRILYSGVPYYKIRRVNLREWKWSSLGNPEYQPRLVSNKVRFYGKVHETVRPRAPFGLIDVPIIHNHLGPSLYTLPPYYFHGVRLDTVPFTFRMHAAFNHVIAFLLAEF